MSISTRIGLPLGLAFLLTLAGLAFYAAHLFEFQARLELQREARLMLDSATATRAYTSAEILPLLSASLQHEFLPQSVPFYAATQNFLRLHAQHPDYSYKEATLNPTNLRDRATDWEADIIQQFRNDSHSRELVGERNTPMGPVLYLARPIAVSKECLECHSEPAAAPKTLLARYGANNGFGWQPDEVVGAQVISVPLAVASSDAHKTLVKLVMALAISFVLLGLLVHWLLRRHVLSPLRQITALADSVSKGNENVNFPAASSREFGVVVQAFERMRISLQKAMRLLGH
jgi:HAMP domain-containing protein